MGELLQPSLQKSYLWIRVEHFKLTNLGQRNQSRLGNQPRRRFVGDEETAALLIGAYVGLYSKLFE